VGRQVRGRDRGAPRLATIRGLEEYGAPITVYAEEGEELVIELLPEALAGEARYLLHDVRVGGRSLGRETELRLRVSGPINVSASYRLQLLVWPRLLGGDGSVAEPDLVVLTSPLGEASSEGGSALWLDSVLTGNGTVGWRLVKAVYRGVDVTLEQVLTPYEPGALYARAPLSHLRVSVRDLVGMPVPMAQVTYEGARRLHGHRDRQHGGRRGPRRSPPRGGLGRGAPAPQGREGGIGAGGGRGPDPAHLALHSSHRGGRSPRGILGGV